MGQIMLNGNAYGGINGPSVGDRIVVVPSFESGAKLADIVINNETTSIYMPSGGTINDVQVNNISVVDQYGVGKIDLSPYQLILTPGQYISINNNTINTTFGIFQGATASSSGAYGLVPAPSTADKELFLKGDGTWSELPASGRTVIANPETIPTDDLTKILIDNITYSVASSGSSVTDVTVDGTSVVNQLGVAEIDLTGKQDTLTAGTNITISNGTISATDTTYSDFAGSAHGLVPAASSGDSSKYLKGDGTWDTPSGGGGGGASVSLLTTAQYNALTPAQKTNGTIYFVYATADPNYEYRVCKDGQIIVQRNISTGDVTWWFIGYSNGGNDWAFPQDMQNYDWMPTSNLIYGVSYDSDKTTPNAQIGVYNGYAREWSLDLGSLVGYNTWGVVTNSGGSGQNNPWSDPPDTNTENAIYYMGYKFSAYS